jgi:hypothetical protein
MFFWRSRTIAAVFTTCLALPAFALAQAGPVAAYGFNEGAGTAASDASGTGNSGVITGATWSAAGKYGGALSFNGTSNWVTVNDAASLDLTTGMTLEAWVKPSALADWRTVLLKENGSGLVYALYASDAASRPSGWVRRSGDVNVTASSALPLNTWSHLAVTSDGANVRLFINGTQVATRASTGAIAVSASPLRIGGNAVWSEYFAGLIDEVRVYNRALTAAQIQTDMNTPVGGTPPPLTWTLSGAITPAAQGGAAVVNLSGAAIATVSADAAGAFTFANLADGAYTVTPVKSGVTMTPANRAVTIAGASVGSVNFTATVTTGPDVTPPSVSISAPTAGTTVFSTTMLSATASDNVGVAGVRLQVDNADLGSEIVMPPYSVSWNTTLVADGPHSVRAIARDAAGNTTTSAAVSVTVSNSADPAVVGQWGASFDVGIVAVNTVLLRTGKVLMFSGSYVVSDTERIWDPATGAITLVPNPYYNLFCAGQAQLPDGRILVAGGFDPNSLGAPNANIFDPVSLQWTALPNMAYRRWYPTVTTLPDGRMLVMSGGTTCLTCLVDVPEIFNPVTNKFTQLTGSRLTAPYYPFMYVLPDGRVIDAGANEQPFATHALDLGTGAWAAIDSVVKDGHSSAMFRPGKILKTGTSTDSGGLGNAAATAYVLDMTQPDPKWRQVQSMAFPRAFQNSTILPDGNVLVTGGGTALDGYDVTKGVLSAELWSPATETWQTLSKGAYARLYHSTTLLLPDARVLIAGSGDDGPAVNNRRAEIYSPPYLFKGARPTYTAAPGLVQYGASFTVQSPAAASIASVAFIRPGSVTHSFDEDQRYVPLTFSASGSTLTIQAPANANLAPPGYYMLFIVNSSGVPSIASFVQLPSPSADSQPPSAPTNVTAQGSLGSASLSWNASTDNTGIGVYNVHRSTVPGFVPSAGNRIAQPVGTTFTNTGLAQGTYYYVVTAQDVAGNVSAPSNEAGVTVFGDTTAPSVSLTSPLDQASVSGSITIAASASDDVGVVGLQFKLDGAPLGVETTSTPYSMLWNSATVANGSHTLSAVARDAAGNTTTATPVSITVSNTTQAPVGLVAALGFNEGSGTVTVDSSASGNNGALVNGAAWSASGHSGAALSFSANGWVTIADAASLDLTSSMTLEAWVRPTSGTGWRTVLLKEAGSLLSYGLYSANNASRPGVWTQTAGADYFLLGTGAVATNAWTHLAVTYGGSTLRFFVNGVQVSSKASVAAISTSTGSLKIGGNAIWGEYFRGLIDDVRIYNRALSITEIQTDMNTGIQ